MTNGFEKNESRAYRLEKGMAVRRFSSRQQPEQGNLIIRRETSYILWHGSQTGKDVISEYILFFSFFNINFSFKSLINIRI